MGRMKRYGSAHRLFGVWQYKSHVPHRTAASVERGVGGVARADKDHKNFSIKKRIMLTESLKNSRGNTFGKKQRM